MRTLSCLVISIMLFSFCPLSTHAQIVYGPIIGANSSDFDVDLPKVLPINVDFRRRVGLGIGWGFDYYIGNFGALSLQFLYLQKGKRVSIQDVTVGNSEVDFKLDYLEVPLFLKLGFGTLDVTHLYIFGGPNIGFNLRARAEVATPTTNVDFDINRGIKTFDLGFGLGVGLHFPVTGGNRFVFFEGRYIIGTSNVLEKSIVLNGGSIETGTIAKSRDLQLMLGVSFSSSFPPVR
ncbi:MAG: PorT family protein [Calditrichaeota bacterium]|nr:MAG: PorT family protein [Calditrichota bacterium]